MKRIAIFLWTNDSHEAFEKLKGKLISAPVHSNPDFPKTFILDTDANNRAICGVLSQVIDVEEHGIAYGSHIFLKTERPYCVKNCWPWSISLNLSAFLVR